MQHLYMLLPYIAKNISLAMGAAHVVPTPCKHLTTAAEPFPQNLACTTTTRQHTLGYLQNLKMLLPSKTQKIVGFSPVQKHAIGAPHVLLAPCKHLPKAAEPFKQNLGRTIVPCPASTRQPTLGYLQNLHILLCSKSQKMVGFPHTEKHAMGAAEIIPTPCKKLKKSVGPFQQILLAPLYLAQQPLGSPLYAMCNTSTCFCPPKHKKSFDIPPHKNM